MDLLQSTELQAVKTAHHTLPEGQVSNEYQNLRVVGMVADNSACGYYRVILPLHMLKLMGAKVSYSAYTQGNLSQDYDFIIAPRQHNPEILELLRGARFEGPYVIYEIDDDLHHVEPSNPAYTAYHNGTQECRMIPKFLSESDGWTTTTPDLAKWYYKDNQNVAIIDNFIDYTFRDWGVDVSWENGNPIFNPREIQRPEEWGDKIVLAWSGGTSHQGDLRQVGFAVASILKRNDNVLFAFYGSWDNYQWFINEFKIPADRTTYIKARHFLDYPAGLHGFDISLAPIECNQFNLCKSYLRIEEYLAVGSACVASSVGPYARWDAKHPGTVVLVGDGPGQARTWSEGIQRLIDNPAELAAMKLNGRNLMMEQYSLEMNIHRWPSAWAQIAQRRQEGRLGGDPERKENNHYVSYGKAKRNDDCPCGSGKKYKNCHPGGFG